MATSITTDDGGIVTVPDGTGGAGAAVTTTEIINAQWKNSQTRSKQGTNYVDGGIANANPGAVPQMGMVTVDQSYLPPTPPDFPSMDPNNGEAIYNEKVAQLTELISTSFTGFIDTYFPHPQAYDDAIAWCERAIAQGGSGIDPNVENALWQRGRARVLGDSLRAEREAEEAWAGRRFPVPPGALVNQIQEIRLDAGRKLAEINRDITVKVFDTEIENVRFAVKTIVDQRQVALDAAGDYIKTLMLGPQTAMQLATGLQGLQNAYINALVGYFNAQVAAAQPKVQLAIADANIRAEVGRANLAAATNSQDKLIQAYLAGAQLMASQASAGINAINAGASISGQDVTQN